MARIRTVKPELWTDPEFVECSSNARLLFVAALNFASDYGVLLDKPMQLKMQCFPGDNCNVASLIDELVSKRLWLRSTAPNGDKVLIIRTFCLHQRVDKPNEGKWGDPTKWPGFADHSENAPGTIADHSPPEGKGREGSSNAQPLALALIPDHPDGFDAFWALYPKRVDKQKAMRSWRRLKQADRAAVMDDLPIRVPVWAKDQHRFALNPTTYLNGRRWEDEVKREPAAQVVNGERRAPGASW